MGELATIEITQTTCSAPPWPPHLGQGATSTQRHNIHQAHEETRHAASGQIVRVGSVDSLEARQNLCCFQNGACQTLAGSPSHRGMSLYLGPLMPRKQQQHRLRRRTATSSWAVLGNAPLGSVQL